MEHGNHGGMSRDMTRKHYRTFGLNLVISTIVMYLVMFEMIWSWDDFVQNINFFYMALTMAMPMGMLMLLTMGSMYPDKRLNLILHLVMGGVFVLAFVAVRAQVLVGDRQFVRSMIPHHSGAILMCNESDLQDAELRKLCHGPDGIVITQKREIAEMQRILERL